MKTLFLAATLCSAAAFAQDVDPPFQVRYCLDLAVGDSVINIKNTGAGGASSAIGDHGNNHRRALCAECLRFHAGRADGILLLLPGNTERTGFFVGQE